jgi:hypothetical protein
MRLGETTRYACNGVAILALIVLVPLTNAGVTNLECVLQPNDSAEVALSVEPMTWKLENHWLRGNLKRPFAWLTPLEQGDLLATYLDEKGSLQAWQIKNNKARRIVTHPGIKPSPANDQWKPQVAVVKGQPVLVRVGPGSGGGPEARARSTVAIEFTQMDLATGALLPLRAYEVRVFPELTNKGLEIEGALPLGKNEDSYLLVARYSQIYRTRWGLPIPDPEVFDTVCTSLLSGGTNSEFAQVNLPGRSWVQRITFSVSTRGGIECAWIRRNGRDALCYGSIGPSKRWTKPRVVCSGRGSWAEFTDVSIARSQDVTCILWNWDEEGIYVAELRGQERPAIHKVAGWDGYDSQREEGIGLLADAPNLDLCTGPSGTVYAIWALSKRLKRRFPDGETQHRIQVACRVNGRWQPPFTIGEGPGIVRSPSIVVDQLGYAHVAFLRQGEKETFRCFYRSMPTSQLLSR